MPLMTEERKNAARDATGKEALPGVFHGLAAMQDEKDKMGLEGEQTLSAVFP